MDTDSMGKMSQDSLDLNPLRAGGWLIGRVDDVNGCGAVLVPDFVPTKAELVALFRHWWRKAYLTELWCYEYRTSGSDHIRLMPYAHRRMARIEQFITPDDEASAYLDELVELWGQFNPGKPLRRTEVVPATDDEDNQFRDCSGWWFSGFKDPIFNAVAAVIRSQLSPPCDCPTLNCHDLRASASVRVTRGIGCEGEGCVGHVEVHACEEIAARHAEKQAKAALVKYMSETRTTRPRQLQERAESEPADV